MFDTPIGKVSIVPKGEYNSSTPYERLDLVYYGGSGYIVLRDVVGVTPTDGEDYMLLTKGGDKGDKGDQGDKGEKGDTGEQGIQGDQGIQGETGVGIQKIERTSGTGAAGTVDTYTITLTNGNTTTFQVTNGADGEGSGDMLKIVYDKNNKATDVYAYTDTAVSGKQDKITGTAGQIVGFDASGNPVAQEAPATGVTSFNGRTGAIVPQEGDYTASQVGALPSDGVASSADKLANKAKIDGVEFDGTSNVTHFGEAQSVDDTSEITVEIPGLVLENGVKITVSFLGIANRDRPQLNVNGTGALDIEIFNPARMSYIRLDNTDPLRGTYTLVYEKTWATEAWLLDNPLSAYYAFNLLYKPSVLVDLSSNEQATFIGNADITPGVTGTLGISNGGTGASSIEELRAAMFGVSTVLNENSWEDIQKISDLGLGANFWSVGDTKSILVNGTIGSLAVNDTYWVYILGFNHNSTFEGKGITFGSFKTAQTGGKDICLVDAKYTTKTTDGTKCFNMNHWGNSTLPRNTNYGGWKGCDARYDIIGSTNKAPSGYGSVATINRVGYDPENYNIISGPVPNTLMAALPQELRAVMKPITKYTDSTGNNSNSFSAVTASVDYLPLLAEFEIFGARTWANQYEQNYQKQYAYYAAGNSRLKYKHSATTGKSYWWERSPNYGDAASFCRVYTDGDTNYGDSSVPLGLAPAFMV